MRNILPAGACPNGCCEAPENILCEHTCERLAVIPAIYYVIQDVRQVVTYPCDADKAVTAKAEPCLLPRTQVTPELLAHIAISKVLDGLPLYRQERQASRFNCPIPRDKLTRWFIALGSQLKAFVDMLVAHYNEHDVGGIDETGIQVIKEAGRTAEQKSYLFTRYGGSSTQPVMIVNYRQRKDYATVKAILEGFESGHIVSDMNPTYIRFAKNHDEVTLNACHDHARRKFDAALALIPKNKREGSFPERILQLYGQIYAVEKEVKRRSPRVIKRKRKRARKFLNQLYRLIDQQAFRPTSRLGDACQYALNHKQALYSYIDKPMVPISNIMSEHIAKKIAVARKNFLFCYGESGAHAIANVMSVVYTSDLYKDHNLHDYLTALFLELPKATTMDDLEALLPWNFTPSQVANIVAARPRPTINGEPIAHAA